VDAGRGPKFGERDAVVAAQHYRDDAGAVDGLQPFGYALVARFGVAGDDRHVAVVYDREVVEDDHVEARVVASEEVRGAADSLGAEACTGAEGRPCVERGADYRGVGVLEVPHVREAHEGSHAGEARGLERVGGFVAGQGLPPIHLVRPRWGWAPLVAPVERGHFFREAAKGTRFRLGAGAEAAVPAPRSRLGAERVANLEYVRALLLCCAPP
jgi:hypothetical protein